MIKKFFVLAAGAILGSAMLTAAPVEKPVSLRNWRSQGALVSNAENGDLLLTYSKGGGGYPQARKSISGDLSGFDTLTFKVKSSAPLRDLTVIFWSNGQRAIAGSAVYANENALPENEWIECRWHFRRTPGWITPVKKTPFDFDKINAVAFNCGTAKFKAGEKVTVEISDVKFINGNAGTQNARLLSNINWKKEGADFTRTADGLKITYSKKQGKYPQVRKMFPNGLAGYNRFSCEIRSSVPMPGLAFILYQGKYRAIASSKEVAKTREFPAGKWCKVQWDFRKTPGWITPPRNTPFDFDKANAIAFNCTTSSLSDGVHILEVRNMRFEYVEEGDSAEKAARKKFAAGNFSGTVAGKKVVVWPNHGVRNGNALEIFINSIDLYKALPIDGVNLDMAPAPFRDSFFSSCPIDDAAFENAVKIVKATDWGNLKHNFFRIDIAGAWGKNPDGSRRRFDWFDDAAWKIILDKITRFAAACRECGFNIMFDTEAYTTEPYDYFRYYRSSGKTFAEYQKQARVRGRQVAEAFAKGHPEAVIMMMFASWVVKISPEQDRYGLLPSFLDGMLDVENKLTLIDGYEGGYEFTDRASVINGLYNIKAAGPVKSSDPEQYKKKIKTGFGIWLRPSVFTPEQFNTLLKDTLELSDGFVWIYLQGSPVTDEKVRKCFAAVQR